MDKVSVYIKNLIAVILSFSLGGYIASTVHVYVGIPVAFLILSFMYFKITGKKPDYLYGLPSSEKFISAKGGFWLLFKYILTFLGLIYDIIIWTITGVYVLFQILIDILLLIKTIIFWIIHAILWFLKLFVPPIVFLYKIFLHYCIHWIWWIYKLTFRNVGISVNKNFYFTSLYGAVISIFLILLFYGVGVLAGIPQIVFVGIVFSILPVVWSYGEISAMRHENRYDEDYSQVRFKFASGMEAVKAVLYYIVIMLVAVLAQIVLNMLGWIPEVGFTLLGISLNINTALSFLMIFVFVILIFADLMIPPHVVISGMDEEEPDKSINLLGIIGSKFIRYILSLLPGSFFGAVLAVIPALVVGLAIFLTLNIKENVLDARLTGLKALKLTTEGADQYKIKLKADRLAYYQDYPMNTFDDFSSIKSLVRDKKSMGENIISARMEMKKVEDLLKADIAEISAELNGLSGFSDENSSLRKTKLENSLEGKKLELQDWQESKALEIAKLELKLKDTKGFIAQLPIVFLLTIIWVSFFGGLVLAVLIAYFGNVFFELYSFKEDEKPTYFWQVASSLNKEDKNQPLLGFTLFVVVGVIVYFLAANGL